MTQAYPSILVTLWVTVVLLGARQMMFRHMTLRQGGVPRTKNNRSTRRKEKHNKEKFVPIVVVLSLTPAQRYTRCSS